MKSEVSLKTEKAGKMTALRLDPKTRYLADLAAEVTGKSLTGYLEEALRESFKTVTLRLRPELEPMYLGSSGKYEIAPIDEEQERMKDQAMSLANLADSLWSESDFGRLQSLSILAAHLVTSDDKALLEYIHTRKDLQTPAGIGYKLNRAKIESEWEAIKTDFQRSKEGRKA